VLEAACKVQDALQQSVAVDVRDVRSESALGHPDDVGQQHWGICAQTKAFELSGTS
jgi:hypothetical protein